MAFQKEWWHTDTQGRRIGWMEPVEFESILAGYYTDRGWVRAFCADFDYSPPTVYRYVQGLAPIPKDVAMIVMMISKLGGPENLPEIEAPWLPEATLNKHAKAA
jgi:hypothetical protein